MPTNKRHRVSQEKMTAEINVTEMSVNVDQRIICVTEDKVILCFYRHLGQLQARRAWVAPAGIVLTIALALATANFNQRCFDVPSAVWHALFLFLGVVSLVWLVITIVRIPARLTPEELAGRLRDDAAHVGRSRTRNQRPPSSNTKSGSPLF